MCTLRLYVFSLFSFHVFFFGAAQCVYVLKVASGCISSSMRAAFLNYFAQTIAVVCSFLISMKTLFHFETLYLADLEKNASISA